MEAKDLDAFVLDNGQSLHDSVVPQLREMQLEMARQFGDGWKIPVPSAEAMAMVVNAENAIA